MKKSEEKKTINTECCKSPKYYLPFHSIVPEKKVQVESNKSIMQIILTPQNSFCMILLCSGLHRRAVAILSIVPVIFHDIHYKSMEAF